MMLGSTAMNLIGLVKSAVTAEVFKGTFLALEDYGHNHGERRGDRKSDQVAECRSRNWLVKNKEDSSSN